MVNRLASGATGETAPQSFILPRSEWVPNNPRLPVLFYKNAIKVAGGDPAALFEAAFAAQRMASAMAQRRLRLSSLSFDGA